MEAFNSMKYLFKFGTVIVFAYFISEAAMYFNKPAILWWYIVPFLIAGTNVETNTNNEQEENEEEEDEYFNDGF